MQDNDIKFTIIVPTRERADTLFFCLKTLLDQDYCNYQILVSDNCSLDDTCQMVSGLQDPRIRYVNTGKRVSMSHNWEFALSHVKDGWVLFIGDDDGLAPGALCLLNNVIKKTRCEAITTANYTYWWPNHFPSILGGDLTIPIPEREVFEIKNSAEMLKKVMNGQAPYRSLPWLYNGGAASINLINRLRTLQGQYFRSLNPDIYSAITLALGSKNYASIKVPIAINGASKHSGGTSLMLGQKGDLNSPTAKFLAEENMQFHPALVFGMSYQIMAYECYLQANHLYSELEFKLKDQIKIALTIAPKVNFREIWADCLVMAGRGSIEMPSRFLILFSRKIFTIRRLFVRLQDRAHISFPAVQLGASNVWVASHAAHHIYEALASICSRSYIVTWLIRCIIIYASLTKFISRKVSKL